MRSKSSLIHVRVKGAQCTREGCRLRVSSLCLSSYVLFSIVFSILNIVLDAAGTQ